MSKIANVIYMLDLLKSGNKYTINELSEKVGVSERMIKYYKSELENIGIYIDSIQGSFGGYIYNARGANFNQITKYDIDLMNTITSYLKEKDHNLSSKFDLLLEKFTNIYNIETEKSKFIKINSDNQNVDLEKSIELKSKLEINYEDISGIIQRRFIHPLYLFEYKGVKYLTAFCELRADIRHFEIKRIKKIIKST